MKPRLIFLEESRLPREVVAESERLEIGRSPEVGLVIADRTVSRRHAVLRRQGDELVLEDLGSTFGTFVNGRAVGSGNAVALKDGDVVRVGQVQMVYRLEPEARDLEEAAGDAAFAAQANARLLVLEGESVRRWPIASPVARIGSAPHCEVRLQDRSGPPEAALVRASGGAFQLEPRAPGAPPRLNEAQEPVRGPTALPSGSVILTGRAQLLFLYDYGPDGRRIADPLAAAGRRALLRHVAVQTGAALAHLTSLAKDLDVVGQNLGEVLVQEKLVTPVFWRVVCSRLGEGPGPRRWFGLIPRRE
ncbi:MAG: FHA domain-containing protein [Planctomycetes bacterium]|nr:FHA domain-containing protein [Planctomycetota bacterium]